GSEVDALHHLAIELESSLRGCRINRDVAFSADHTAANVVTNRTHGDRPFVSIGQNHTAHGHAVAVVNIRCDHYKHHAREPSRVDDLAIQNVFGVFQEARCKKHSDRHIASVLGAELVKTLAIPSCE